MAAAMRELQQQMEEEVKALRAIQKDISKNHQVRQQYSIQLNENELVKKELDALEVDARVFKLVGPVLVPQDLVEAKANVEKRVEYITAETARLEKMLESLEKRQSSKQEDVLKLQKRLQTLAAAGK